MVTGVKNKQTCVTVCVRRAPFTRLLLETKSVAEEVYLEHYFVMEQVNTPLQMALEEVNNPFLSAFSAA